MDRHRWLRKLWLEDKGVFAYLSPREQTLLHLYYVPADNRSDEQLIEHRTQATKANRFLAHRAGKAYNVLVRGEENDVTLRLAGIDARPKPSASNI